MRLSLRTRLPLTYLLVIVLASLGSALFVNPALWQYFVRERKLELLTQGSLVAYAAGLDLQGDGLALDRLAQLESQRLESRVMFIAPDSRVLVDAYGELAGTKIDHAELKTSLSGQSVAVVRQDALEPVLYVYVPIAAAGRLAVSSSEIIGVALIATSLADLRKKQQIIAQRLISGSLLMSLLAVPMAIYFAFGISTPLVRLTTGAKQMAAGALGTTVQPSGDQEVYELGEAFNAMSLRLATLEEARRKFVGDASHELRTPLASMKALIAPLVGDEQVEHAVMRDFLSEIDRELDRLTRLVDDLLKLARLDSRPTLELTTIDLSLLVRRVVSSLAPLAEERGVRMKMGEMPPTTITADEGRLHSAILNIVDNAVKFARAAVFVTLEADSVLSLRVADDGLGIPPAAVDRLFERFYRVDAARARNTGGSGLGLAIAWEVINLHQGSINVASEPGHGTTITINLPLR